MTEPTGDPAGATGDAQATETGTETTYTPPATQAELDRLITDRVNRTKAQFRDYADLKAKATELDQIKQANQTEAQQQAAAVTRWQTEAETWRAQAVGSKVAALAASDFADSSDAVTALAEKNYLDAGGQIDEQAIQADLNELLEKKPHWRKQADAPPGPRPPSPNPAQGTSGTAGLASPRDQFAAILQSPT